MRPYDYQGYTIDYTIGNFGFVGTCGSHPEQFDVVYLQDDCATQDTYPFQVGYVRLRGGRLYCSFPDVGGQVVYYYEYPDEKYQGEFTDEDDRMMHLGKIAKVLEDKLEGLSYGYS